MLQGASGLVPPGLGSTILLVIGIVVLVWFFLKITAPVIRFGIVLVLLVFGLMVADFVFGVLGMTELGNMTSSVLGLLGWVIDLLIGGLEWIKGLTE